jgi:transposase
MEKLTTIGLDIAKNVFQLHGVDAAGNVLLRKQLRRGDVLLQSWCQHPDNRPLI